MYIKLTYVLYLSESDKLSTGGCYCNQTQTDKGTSQKHPKSIQLYSSTSRLIMGKKENSNLDCFY